MSGIRLIPLAVIVVLLSACTSGGAVPSPTPTPSSTTAAAIAAAMRGKEPVVVFQYGGRIQVAALDAKQGAPVALDTDAGEQVHPDWSPDGQRIAFAADDDDGTRDIWVADLTGVAKKVFDCAAPCAYTDEPAWSPDGASLLFEHATRLPGDTGRYDLTSFDVASGSSSVVVSLNGNEGPYGGRWSPDASQVVTELENFPTPSVTDSNVIGQRVAVVDTRSHELRELVGGAIRAQEPDWSPDGSTIVFGRDPGTGLELYTVPAKGGTPKRITHQGDTGGRVLQASWSQDGRRLIAVWEKTPGAEFSHAALVDPATGKAQFISAFTATHPRLRPTA